jgi:hypothetical protein
LVQPVRATLHEVRLASAMGSRLGSNSRTRRVRKKDVLKYVQGHYDTLQRESHQSIIIEK